MQAALHNHGYRTVDPLKPIGRLTLLEWQAMHNHGYRTVDPLKH